MFSLKNNLKFISIDQKYLKYLHDFCKEVYWQPVGYETKPYLGILVEDKGNEYVIPLSSAKEKWQITQNLFSLATMERGIQRSEVKVSPPRNRTHSTRKTHEIEKFCE